MAFCPVPHSRREQVWLLVGVGLGYCLASALGRRRSRLRTSIAATITANASDPPLDLVHLTEEPLPLGHLASKVVCPSAGGIATFIGTTRDHFEGKQVLRLEVRFSHRATCATTCVSPRCVLSGLQYEAYVPMAEKEIRKIIATIRERWTVRHIAFAHRIGVVPAAESSVEIAISSTHRVEGLEAVRFAIDELKKKVPIWKKEIYDEGKPQWKENKEWEPPR